MDSLIPQEKAQANPQKSLPWSARLRNLDHAAPQPNGEIDSYSRLVFGASLCMV
jgi:hypothetical protein